jgi:hypothetical protein
MRDDEKDDKRTFNVELSRARVKVEHAFGVLKKARFPVLSSLSSVVGSENSNLKVSLYHPFIAESVS